MLDFQKVIPTDSQVNALYELLLNRTSSISHQNVPTIIEHKEFVSSHPYIAWYLVFKKDNVVGAFYIQPDNSIGLNMSEHTQQDVKDILAFIQRHFQPLPAIKSVRRGEFFMNVAPSNTDLLDILQQLGKDEIQRTFAV